MSIAKRTVPRKSPILVLLNNTEIIGYHECYYKAEVYNIYEVEFQIQSNEWKNMEFMTKSNKKIVI